MTRTAWVGRRIAFLRQAFGVTIMVRLGELDPGTRLSYQARLASRRESVRTNFGSEGLAAQCSLGFVLLENNGAPPDGSAARDGITPKKKPHSPPYGEERGSRLLGS